MKRCPKCGKNYTDDTLNFCLDDGTPLSFRPDSDPTLISPTVPFSPRATIPSQTAQPSRAPFRWILFAAIIVIAVMLGGGTVAVIYTIKNGSPPREEKPSKTSSPTPTNSPSTSAKSPSPSVEPSRTNVASLTGEWRVINTLERTSYPAYANLRVGYHLTINETGSEFTGEGEKILENERTMEAFERTPIHVTGSVNGDSVDATFVEEGLRRKTTGRFAWTITAGGNKLSGSFVSSAAKSSGPSVGTRER